MPIHNCRKGSMLPSPYRPSQAATPAKPTKTDRTAAPIAMMLTGTGSKAGRRRPGVPRVTARLTVASRNPSTVRNVLNAFASVSAADTYLLPPIESKHLASSYIARTNHHTLEILPFWTSLVDAHVPPFRLVGPTRDQNRRRLSAELRAQLPHRALVANECTPTPPVGRNTIHLGPTNGSRC